MLRFNLLGVPVKVEPWFWLTCVLLGGGLLVRNSAALNRLAVWTSVVFLSILVHELGHALAARAAGGRPDIALRALGGLTVLRAGRLSRDQRIFISLAGPAAGVALALLILLAGPAFPDWQLFRYAWHTALWVNLGWSLLNLLPLLPLDGSQVMTELFGPRRFKTTRWIGGGIAGVAAVLFATYGAWLATILFAILAWLNIRGDTTTGGVLLRDRSR